MSFASLTTTPGLRHNISLYAVPAGWVLAMAPLWWAVGVANSTSKGAYNNACPKDSWDSCAAKLPPKTAGRVLRAVAANNNSHTNLAIFGAALAAANSAHVDRASLHFYAGGYLLSRVAYTLAYIFIEDPKWSLVRSGCYLSGVISCLALFVKAANKFKNIPW